MYTRGEHHRAAGQPPGGHVGPGLLVHLERLADTVGEDVQDEETEVVPGQGVLRPRVAQADHQQGSAMSVITGVAVGGRVFAALGLSLGLFGLLVERLAATLGLEVFLGRRGDDVDDQQLGIGHQRHTRGQLDVAGEHLGALLGAFDRHGELFGNRLDVGLDLDGVGFLGDQRAGCSFALDDDVDLDGHLLAAAHDEQVGVLDVAADRVDLQRLGQRELLGAGDVECQHGVGAGVAQHGGEVAAVELQVLRVGAVAVEHHGHTAFTAGTARCALAGGAADLSGQIVRGVARHVRYSCAGGDGHGKGDTNCR